MKNKNLLDSTLNENSMFYFPNHEQTFEVSIDDLGKRYKKKKSGGIFASKGKTTKGYGDYNYYN